MLRPEFIERKLQLITDNEHLITSLATGAEERTTRLSYRDTFTRLTDYGVYSAAFAQAIAPSAGLRNVLVHEYNDIDHRIVFNAIHKTLEQFTAYVEHVRRFLDARSTD